MTTGEIISNSVKSCETSDPLEGSRTFTIVGAAALQRRIRECLLQSRVYRRFPQ